MDVAMQVRKHLPRDPAQRVEKLLLTGLEMSENCLGGELFLTIANQIRFNVIARDEVFSIGYIETSGNFAPENG